MSEEVLRRQNHHVELPINGSPVKVELAGGRIRPKLCYLGPAGSYSMEAAQSFIADSIATLSPFIITPEGLNSNGDVVRAVKDSRYDIAVVAVENSIDGDVNESVREIVHTGDTRILGEKVIPIRHMLIGNPDGDLRQILSHPSALGQCRVFINKNYPQAERIEVTSTSRAVEIVKDMKDAAAIASSAAANYYGVGVLEANVGDDPRNSTRFYILGRGETLPTGNDKTTLMLTPQEDRVGLLRDYLDVLAGLGVNLNKISSYPTGKMDFYSFLISINGHERDSQVQEAFMRLTGVAETELLVLGSYKRAPLPEGSKEPGAINGR